MTDACTDCTHKNGWHLDKKVPISIIAILFVQILSFVVFIDRMDNRLAALEQWQAKSETHISRLPSDMEYIKYAIQRIEKKLDER